MSSACKNLAWHAYCYLYAGYDPEKVRKSQASYRETTGPESILNVFNNTIRMQLGHVVPPYYSRECYYVDSCYARKITAQSLARIKSALEGRLNHDRLDFFGVPQHKQESQFIENIYRRTSYDLKRELQGWNPYSKTNQKANHDLWATEQGYIKDPDKMVPMPDMSQAQQNAINQGIHQWRVHVAKETARRLLAKLALDEQAKEQNPQAPIKHLAYHKAFAEKDRIRRLKALASAVITAILALVLYSRRS